MAWESDRPLPGDSRAEQVTCSWDWFWRGAGKGEAEKSRLTVTEARQSDPFEYGYMRAGARGSRDYFLKTLNAERDLARAELMIEGWNTFHEETENEALCIRDWCPPKKGA